MKNEFESEYKSRGIREGEKRKYEKTKVKEEEPNRIDGISLFLSFLFSTYKYIRASNRLMNRSAEETFHSIKNALGRRAFDDRRRYFVLLELK